MRKPLASDGGGFFYIWNFSEKVYSLTPVSFKKLGSIMDLDPFGYGVLALSNPNNDPNEAECDEYSRLVTGKSVYVWPLVFAAYVWHLKDRKGLEFPSELEKIDNYIGRHFEAFKAANPVDFTKAGQQYVSAKAGSFQAIRKDFGSAVKKLRKV